MVDKIKIVFLCFLIYVVCLALFTNFSSQNIRNFDETYSVISYIRNWKSKYGYKDHESVLETLDENITFEDSQSDMLYLFTKVVVMPPQAAENETCKPETLTVNCEG